MNSVILIGMPGCGKSSVAQAFKRKYAGKIFDTDAEIVKKYGEINKIFEEHGEEYFRNLETEVLRRVCAEENCFISAGGGCVLRGENVRIMKSGGNKVVYLKTELSTLLKRLKEDTSRPLLKGDLEERLKKLYLERKEIYERVSDITVDTDGLDPEEISDKIIFALRGAYEC